MAGTRVVASILPSIRCSDCGVEVELSLMAEHLCPKQVESSLPQLSVAQVLPKSSSESANSRPLPFKATKAPPPPQLQMNAIGQPLVSPNELTPASSSWGSSAYSPISTSSGRSFFRAPSRGMTMLSRARPPTPELTNLDCAFPPFPTNVSRSNTPVSDSRSQNSDHESSYVRAPAEPYNAPPPRRGSISTSKRRKRSKTTGGGQDAAQTPSTAVGKRRPSLASVVAGARSGLENVPPLPSPLNSFVTEETQHSTTGNDLAPSLGGLAIDASILASEDKFQFSSSPPRPNRMLATGALGTEEQRGGRRAPGVQVGMKQEEEPTVLKDETEKPVDIAAPNPGLSRPVQEKDGPSYRARRPPPIANTWLKGVDTKHTTSAEKPRISPSRSRTFPFPHGTDTPIKSSPTTAQRRPSEPSVASQFSWPFAPATQAPQEKPLTPAVLPASTSIAGRPYHSPSDSASSYGSVNSVEQSASSRSSQPLQDVEPERLPDIASRISPPEVREPPILMPPKPPMVDYEADSPTDPAFQNGRLTPVDRPGLSRTQTTTPEPPSQTFRNAVGEVERDPNRRPLLRSKTSGGNKGQCRGCSKIIAGTQKSVSSADGRLTGRYHKECFSCTTCHNAFATADFYVLKDQPYCAQHYHALNGSICGSCGRGIEGQYLEATRSEAKGPEKFHAKCFTCVMCRVVLKHDYFAHHGRFFCERDIHRVASPPNRSPNGPAATSNASGSGPSSYLSASSGGMSRGKFPERRSTKLMIMS